MLGRHPFSFQFRVCCVNCRLKRFVCVTRILEFTLKLGNAAGIGLLCDSFATQSRIDGNEFAVQFPFLSLLLIILLNRRDSRQERLLRETRLF